MKLDENGLEMFERFLVESMHSSPTKIQTVQLHLFSDASEQAYSAVILCEDGGHEWVRNCEPHDRKD